MKKATYLVISGSKTMTEFMQACDVFEKSRVVGEITHMDTTFSENDKNVTLYRAGQNIQHIKASLEQKEIGLIVSLVHLVSVESDGKITKNNKDIVPYINKNVKTISDGSKWFIFHTFIKKYCGFDFNTNSDYSFKENSFIKNELLTEKLKNPNK